jgi:hypothetical protein
MPSVPPSGDDDDTRFFGFGDDQTRRMPPAGGYSADATRPMSPIDRGRAMGAAVPPGGHRNTYGGTAHSRFDDDDEYGEEPPPEKSGRRLALIIAGILVAILLVVGGGIALGSKLFGGAPAAETSTPALPSSLAPSTPSETPSASESVSPPPPEGPGPRVLDVGAPPRVDCTDGGTAKFDLSWRVRDADRVDVSMDGNELQQYAPDDEPVSVPFPCDGQAHKYQVTAFSHNDRQSQPSQVTVRPETAPSSPPPSLLFPGDTTG